MLKEKVIKAYNYAEKAHHNQYRKFSNLPYFSHPKGVARILEKLNCSEETIIAALLHDVIEDTKVTYEEIEVEFGETIAKLVLALTSDNEEQSKLGKSIYLLHKMQNMSDTALLIKLADRLHNILYLQGDSVSVNFIKKYYKETRFIIDNLSSFLLSDRHLLLIGRIEGVLNFLNIRHNIEEEAL